MYRSDILPHCACLRVSPADKYLYLINGEAKKDEPRPVTTPQKDLVGRNQTQPVSSITALSPAVCLCLWDDFLEPGMSPVGSVQVLSKVKRMCPYIYWYCTGFVSRIPYNAYMGATEWFEIRQGKQADLRMTQLF